MKHPLFLLILLLFFPTGTMIAADGGIALPAFPGAEGFGRYTVGGMLSNFLLQVSVTGSAPIHQETGILFLQEIWFPVKWR